MSYWHDRRMANRRSIYAVLVERAMEKPNDMDGTTAIRAVPAPYDKTWVETLGITKEDTAQLYTWAIEDYMAGLYPTINGYEMFKNDCVTMRLPSMEGAIVRARIRNRHITYSTNL